MLIIVWTFQHSGVEVAVQPFCVEFACSNYTCVWMLWFPPTVSVNWSFEISHRCGCEDEWWSVSVLALCWASVSTYSDAKLST